ncbi:BrnA antitoxin family protein [Castellaniella sp.]|nr:BrnA antitoxin family protein [Castellaniella sp.]
MLEGMRATGRGWQTKANDVLRDWLREHRHS